MNFLVHHSVAQQAINRPDSLALQVRAEDYSYADLWRAMRQFATQLEELQVSPHDRVAVYLPKQFEAVVSLYGASLAECVFVPVNPVLKAKQVAHILRDCDARVLVTSKQRAESLSEEIQQCSALSHIIVTDTTEPLPGINQQQLPWPEPQEEEVVENRAIATNAVDTDIVAILYTSGSTGKPKGVVLSHKNIVAGAQSVASYLRNTADDKLLAVLPLSFDYGLSQVTTAFSVGASVVLMDYLLPRDVIKAVAKYGVTGLAAVPPLWKQLANLEWPEASREILRYITNSGGAMPVAVTQRLREKLPSTEVFLMYGLTEAFRSTYLPPEQIDRRPGSMGKAIPNAQVLVMRPDGSECDADEPGELVHLGPLVSLGYWNDPAKTAQRFKPAPTKVEGIVTETLAVWSGDQVKRDNDGYLYFITRQDEMIKTSGYRVSPTEIEEEIYASGLVNEAIAFGVEHPELGQAIIVVAEFVEGADQQTLLRHCQQQLANFMVPKEIVALEQMPRNPNGKIDRTKIKSDYLSSPEIT